MPSRTGTHDLASLLANTQQTAADFGLDTIQEVFAADLEADTTSDRQRLYGTSSNGEMLQVDEYGRGPTQKPSVGVTVGFPLRLYQFAVGWTRKWFQQRSVADTALTFQNAQKAHRKAVVREVKRAVFGSSNFTFRDKLIVPQVDLAVKRFVNADSANIPEGPNGESYNGATHTHYLANATLTAGALLSLIQTVQEHGLNGGELRVAISATDRTAVEALTGFKAYPDPRIRYVATDQNEKTIDIARMDDLAIGTFGAAEVWVKPWAIANYAVAYIVGAEEKPLVVRTRSGSNALVIAAALDAYPLHAEYMEAEFGVGVWNRTAGGVLYFANGTYADPTIN
jgi:hypothetical protein